jgi:hypothetical protein
MENRDDFTQKFGYAEMYEWSDPSVIQNRLGIFVQFDPQNPNKIIPFDNGELIGVSTINSTIESDNPDHWKHANMCNEVGDLYLRKEKLAVGQKVYDEVLEFNYIVTRPWEHYITVPNKAYNPELQYIPRTSRGEWVKVNLIGKCIIRDNGECQPGSYCKPYEGKLKQKFGTAIPANKGDENSYYVLERLTESTIMILFK